MLETVILAVIGGIFALLLGRSAIIAVWPDSDAAKFCESKLGFLDSANDSDGGGDDCGGGDGGGD